MSTGTVTDMVEYCRLLEELENALEGQEEAQGVVGRMSALVVLNMDIPTMTRNLLRGMPDKREELEECFRKFGWLEESQGY